MIQQLVHHWWVQGVEAFVMSLALYISWWSQIDMMRDQATMSNQVDGSTYDFIVVGAGSAGCVVAHRLSTHFNVLLLEAGGDPFPVANIPGFSIGLLNYPEIDWMHRTVPQTHSCGACIKNESGWSQGKGLGGTSNTNFMIHSRGHPLDFEQWANITGDSRWNYESVLEYFKKSENYFGDEWRDSNVHGQSGPLRIETVGQKYGGDLFVKAAQELGYPNVDVNGRFTEGFDLITYPIKRGVRQSTYNAYIRPIFKRRSLTVKKFSHVNQILFKQITDQDGSKPEAIGVEFDRHDKTFIAYASKEIIISAGIQSSKLLMLSGIGPKHHLESLGIDAKVDSPRVGQNLQDHISTYLGPFIVNPGSPIVIVDRDFTAPSFIEYLQKGTGILAQTGAQAIGFVSVSNKNKTDNDLKNGDIWPEIQYLYLGAHLYVNDGKDFARAFHLKENTIREYAQRINKGRKDVESFSIITSLSRPYQRGEILLKSKDPYDDLVIDPKYFHDERDLQVLVEGVKKAVEIVEMTDTFRSIGAKFTDEIFPGCETKQFRSDEYWKCFIKQMSITLHHIVGHCAFGSKNALEAVVDSELRVNGVENLRVIDASVMPRHIVGNTNAPTIMVAERGASFILEKWLKSSNSV